MDLIIQIKTKEKGIVEKSISGEIYFLKNSLIDVYQNSPEIANVKMENSAPDKSLYSQYGCRFTGISRSIIYELNKQNIKDLTILKLDELADSGGEKFDAWKDGYYPNGTPFYDILDGQVLVNKVNKLYKTNLKYNLLTQKFGMISLVEYIQNDHPITIKMKQLYSKGDHFVNVTAAIINDNELYFKMKETYNNYNGYDGFWINWNYPLTYEVII